MPLNFNVTFEDPTGTYSTYYNLIKSNLVTAGTSWSKYIQASGNLEVLVNFSNSGPTALGRSLTTSLLRKNGSLDVYEQGATSEIRTGIDPNGASPDIEISFNPDYLINELWFDPNPSSQTTLVPTNKTDAVSVLTHELGHAFAFNGWRKDDGTLTTYESTFDEKTVFDGTNLFFTGTKATAVYGSAVPLTFGNATHLGNSSPRPGSDLIPDLMNGVVFDRGTRYTISALDLAIFTDTTGISTGSVVPTSRTVPLADVKKEPAKYMAAIRDYDGNDLGRSSSWKLLGDVDIQGDGDVESILVNPAIGRFASVGAVGGNVDFTNYGLNGDTRVVGIYIDPTLKTKPQNIGGPFDSQRRFQNDLKIDNLKLLAAADYNQDGFQDLYFKLGDGSAVLRALMFKDGNIQYANYQSKTDLAAFMTANNVSNSVWGNWL